MNQVVDWNDIQESVLKALSASDNPPGYQARYARLSGWLVRR